MNDPLVAAARFYLAGTDTIPEWPQRGVRCVITRGRAEYHVELMDSWGPNAVRVAAHCTLGATGNTLDEALAAMAALLRERGTGWPLEGVNYVLAKAETSMQRQEAALRGAGAP